MIPKRDVIVILFACLLLVFGFQQAVSVWTYGIRHGDTVPTSECSGGNGEGRLYAHDDGAVGEEVNVCTPTGYAACCNPYGTVIDCNELNPTMTCPGAFVLDLNTNGSTLKLHETTTIPGAAGVVTIDPDHDAMRFYDSSDSLAMASVGTGPEFDVSMSGVYDMENAVRTNIPVKTTCGTTGTSPICFDSNGLGDNGVSELLIDNLPPIGSHSFSLFKLSKVKHCTGSTTPDACCTGDQAGPTCDGQALPSSSTYAGATFKEIVFDTEGADTDGYFSFASNRSRATIAITGLYVCTCSAVMEQNSDTTTRYMLRIRDNEALALTYANSSTELWPGGTANTVGGTVTVTSVTKHSATKQVWCEAAQVSSSSSALDILTFGGNGAVVTSFGCAFVGKQ